MSINLRMETMVYRLNLIDKSTGRRAEKPTDTFCLLLSLALTKLLGFRLWKVHQTWLFFMCCFLGFYSKSRLSIQQTSQCLLISTLRFDSASFKETSFWFGMLTLYHLHGRFSAMYFFLGFNFFLIFFEICILILRLIFFWILRLDF